LKNVARAVDNKKSYFFTDTGATFHLLPSFLAIRHHWGPLMAWLGTIESLVSTAHLLQKNQSESSNWCLAEYLESDTPHFIITQYSHPMMNANKAVKNTIQLGTSNSPKGIVITGANTAGKTMNIQSITLALLLGQSLTIAHAQKLKYTPVHKILSYLNSTDNISANKSLFQIEEARILSIVNQLYNLAPGSRSFVAIDELFSSAAPTTGQAAAFGICYGLSTLPLCTPIVATHFKKLTALPEHTNNFYANYHLVIPNANTNNINAEPFVLTPEASTQIIAFDLARASGFDSEIIDSAEEFLSSSRRAFTESNND
jgi:DNA mismatch repair ATPase MutS